MIIYESFFYKGILAVGLLDIIVYGVKKQDFEKHGQIYYIIVSQPRLSR